METAAAREFFGRLAPAPTARLPTAQAPTWACSDRVSDQMVAAAFRGWFPGRSPTTAWPNFVVAVTLSHYKASTLGRHGTGNRPIGGRRSHCRGRIKLKASSKRRSPSTATCSIPRTTPTTSAQTNASPVLADLKRPVLRRTGWRWMSPRRSDSVAETIHVRRTARRTG